MSSPLAWLAVFIGMGIWISSFIRIPISFITAAAGLSILVFFFTIKRRYSSFLALSMMFILIGCLLYQTKQIYPSGHIKNFTPEEPYEAYLEGVIATEPQADKTYYGLPKTSFMVEADGLKIKDARLNVLGKVKVAVFGNAAPTYGDRVLLRGFLSKPGRPGNPGEFDYSRYLERNGVFSVFSARSEDLVILRKGEGNPILMAAYEARNKIRVLIMSHLPRDNAGFLVAILLGLRQDMGDELNDIFIKTGTVHILPRLYTKMPSVAL